MANDSWIKSKSNQFLIVAALIIPVGYCLNACNGPKIYPVTQSVEDVKRENDRRIKSITGIAGDRSVVCTKEIPVFDGFKLINRAAWVLESRRADQTVSLTYFGPGRRW